MEPCAGFAERFIRRASEKPKSWDSLDVDEGFATVARAEPPPDSILDRKVHQERQEPSNRQSAVALQIFFWKRSFLVTHTTLLQKET